MKDKRYILKLTCYSLFTNHCFSIFPQILPKLPSTWIPLKKAGLPTRNCGIPVLHPDVGILLVCFAPLQCLAGGSFLFWFEENMNRSNLALWLGGISLAALVSGVVISTTTLAQEAKQNPAETEKLSPEEVPVRKALIDFVTAFNSNNAKAMAATLSPKVEYIDEESNRVEGAAKVEELLSGFFKENKGAQLELTPSGIRMLGTAVAMEDAESIVSVEDKNSQSSRRVSILYAKEADGWKIASYREYPQEIAPPENADRLRELSFLLGEWADEAPDSTLRTKFSMAEDNSHILREFSLIQDGKETLKGTQRIAVDPLSGNIKGWTFDNAGGYGVATFTPNGDSWVVRGTGVTPEGEEASATYIIKSIGPDRIEFKAINRMVGNLIEPDQTSTLVRKLAKAPEGQAKP